MRGEPCLSQASAKVQFMKVLPEPGSGQQETIIIKNVGEKPVDLTGWSVVDKSQRAMNSYWFGGDSMTITPSPSSGAPTGPRSRPTRSSR